MKLSLVPFLFLLLQIACSQTCIRPTCVTYTDIGKFEGNCYDSFSEYLGIPYAKPPVANLRFSASVPYVPTGSGTIQAKVLPPYCPQVGSAVSSITEDCLYLNIYSPKSISPSSVMLFVHGGSFLQGGSADPVFNGSALAQSQNVVVVTVNYRLGVLGFYDSVNTGTNFGLTDVVNSLNWIKNNIAKFGGDPNSVTVFGQSSGGTLVRTLLMTPSAKGLFKRAIIQSDPEAYSANSASVSQSSIAPVIENSLGCTEGDIVSCLRNSSVSDILTAQITVLQMISQIPGANTVYPFGPNIDSSTLPADLSSTVNKGVNVVNPVDVIFGVVKDEAAPAIGQLFGTAGIDPLVYNAALAIELGPVAAAEVVGSGVFLDYINNNQSYSTGMNYEQQLISVATEYEFSCPNQLTAGKVSSLSGKNVYFYQFVDGITHPDNVGNVLCSGGSVCHEDDLYVVFGTYPEPSNLSGSQKQLVSEVQNRWGSFARTGNPDFTNSVNSTWLPVSGNNLHVLLLGESKVQSYIDKAQCEFLDTKVGYKW